MAQLKHRTHEQGVRQLDTIVVRVHVKCTCCKFKTRSAHSNVINQHTNRSQQTRMQMMAVLEQLALRNKAVLERALHCRTSQDVQHSKVCHRWVGATCWGLGCRFAAATSAFKCSAFMTRAKGTTPIPALQAHRCNTSHQDKFDAAAAWAHLLSAQRMRWCGCRHQPPPSTQPASACRLFAVWTTCS